MKLVTLIATKWARLICLHWCWWRMLETECVGDKFEMLMTHSVCWWPISNIIYKLYIGKITNPTKQIANIMILQPASQIGHQHNDVTNITVTHWYSLRIMIRDVGGILRWPVLSVDDRKFYSPTWCWQHPAFLPEVFCINFTNFVIDITVGKFKVDLENDRLWNPYFNLITEDISRSY